MRQRLKEARLNAGLTQEKMAEMLGISLRHYKYIESGKTQGAIGLWDQMEDMFDVISGFFAATQKIIGRDIQDICYLSQHVDVGRRMTAFIVAIGSQSNHEQVGYFLSSEAFTVKKYCTAIAEGGWQCRTDLQVL